MKTYALAIALVATAGCGGSMSSSAPSTLLDRPLPTVSRRTLDGAPVDAERLRGHVVVIDFFAEYCAPCLERLPAIEQLAREGNVAVLGIAEDEREADVRDLARSAGLTFPIVHDVDRTMAARFRVTDMPITFVTDAKGIVRWVGGPDQSQGDLRDAVAAIGR